MNKFFLIFYCLFFFSFLTQIISVSLLQHSSANNHVNATKAAANWDVQLEVTIQKETKLGL